MSPTAGVGGSATHGIAEIRNMPAAIKENVFGRMCGVSSLRENCLGGGIDQRGALNHNHTLAWRNGFVFVTQLFFRAKVLFA